MDYLVRSARPYKGHGKLLRMKQSTLLEIRSCSLRLVSLTLSKSCKRPSITAVEIMDKSSLSEITKFCTQLEVILLVDLPVLTRKCKPCRIPSFQGINAELQEILDHFPNKDTAIRYRSSSPREHDRSIES